jgi:hypothetical protein
MQERDDFEDVNGGRGVNFLLVAQKKRKRKTKSVEKLRSLSLFRRRRHPGEGQPALEDPRERPAARSCVPASVVAEKKIVHFADSCAIAIRRFGSAGNQNSS